MPNGIHDPTHEFFNYVCVRAHAMITSGEEPDWFRERFGQGQSIEEQYAIPPDIPLVFALALHLSFEMPTADALKRHRRKVKEERSHLKKTRARLLALRDFPLTPLTPDCLRQREMPDGSTEFEFEPDPFEEFIQANDRFSERLSAVKVGRRTSSVPIAVRRLNDYVDQNNPALNLAQRDALCQDLFDEIRERHGHRSRSPNRDQNEMPRYIDILTRSKRSGRPSKRKTGQEMG